MSPPSSNTPFLMNGHGEWYCPPFTDEASPAIPAHHNNVGSFAICEPSITSSFDAKPISDDPHTSNDIQYITPFTSSNQSFEYYMRSDCAPSDPEVEPSIEIPNTVIQENVPSVQLSAFLLQDMLYPMRWQQPPQSVPDLGFPYDGIAENVQSMDHSTNFTMPHGPTCTHDLPIIQRSDITRPRYTSPPSLQRSRKAAELCICGFHHGSVPQRTYPPKKRSITERLGEGIHFLVDNECGIAIDAALWGIFSGLRGRDDSVFADMDCGVSISLRFEWPGYPSWTCQMRTQDWRKKTKPIPRSKLAKEVAKHFNRFLTIMAEVPFDEDEDSKWQIGKGHVVAGHVRLIRLERVSKGSWQPHFRLAEEEKY